MIDLQELVKENISNIAKSAADIPGDAMGESFARDELMKDVEKNMNNPEAKEKQPRPLWKILEKTENCTLIEHKAGHLYRKYTSSLNEKTMNHDIITRIRYLLQTNNESFLQKTKEELKEELDSLVRWAFCDVYPLILPKQIDKQFRFYDNSTVDKNEFLMFILLPKTMESVTFSVAVGKDYLWNK